MTKRIEITVSEELWDRLESARGLVARAAWVKAAVESSLGGSLPGVVERGRVLEAAASPGRIAGSFRCPIYTCEFTASSAAAVCGRHGRKVIAA